MNMNNIFSAIILGIVQGFTEFLPVSSSGHLVIAEKFLPNIASPGVLMEVMLHLATTLAVLFYFRKEIFKYDVKFWFLVAIASIPAGIVGVLFNSQIENLFNNLQLVGFALLITSIFNFSTDRLTARREKIKVSDAIIIGLLQAFAIIPGVSRSGSTIFAGASMGVHREKAAKFSFLMSIPAILGASAIELFSYQSVQVDWLAILFGGVAAFISGVFAIYLVFEVLLSKRFTLFGIYTLLIGLLTIFVLS